MRGLALATASLNGRTVSATADDPDTLLLYI
jgi:hypothetical protein